MSKPLFSQKIVCQLCGRKHKGKMNRSKRVYICSTHDNYKKCKRLPIKEEELLLMLDMRYNRRLSREEIKECVKEVRVYVDKFEIEYSDGHTALSSDTKVEF